LKHEHLLRALPSVDAVLATPATAAAMTRHGRRLVVAEVRRRLHALRQRIRSGDAATAADGAASIVEAVAREVVEDLHARAQGLVRPVINATGVLVHTNLGRAPLGPAALRRIAERAGGSVNLEIDLETGRRGRRGEGTETLLAELCGAEAALVVNNNAAALVLALNTFALGRAVVVSRGELVEIGGSFRVPDICERAGVRLVEVGTTNRTRTADFAAVLASAPRGDVGLVLKVHPSNFRVVGFTEEAPLHELAALAREHGVPVLMDQGSGVLEDLTSWGVPDEPAVPALVEAGADVVCFSGDKLLGGPQAGCMVGTGAAIEACRQNPLYRALRAGRLVHLALEATLWSHATGRLDDVPVQAQLRLPPESVKARARELCRDVSGASRGARAARLEVRASASTSGGGSSPRSSIPTFVVAVSAADVGADELARRLRQGQPSVLARIEDDAVLLDLRTVPPEHDRDVGRALVAALGGTAAVSGAGASPATP
jgi:L-seryl-tRNA(Ser) seleniumtransferase